MYGPVRSRAEFAPRPRSTWPQTSDPDTLRLGPCYLVCAAGDEIWSAVIRRDLPTDACRSAAHEQPRSEIVHSVTHTLTCTHARCCVFPWQLTMMDFRLLLVVSIAAPDKHRRSFFFHFQKAERPKGGPQGTSWTRFAQRNRFFADAHINLILSGFAHHKSDLGLPTFWLCAAPCIGAV